MLPPNAKLDRLAGPASEPLSLADAKGYLRVETPDEDALIADMIVAARIECERINDRSFIATTWRLTLDALPWGPGPGGAWHGGVSLPMPPLISLSSLRYVDLGGVWQTIDPATLIVSAGTPGRIAPPYGNYYPLSQPRPAAVELVYVAGYGPDATAVPRSVVMAIRLLVAHYHRHRTTDAEVPAAICNLLSSTAWGGYA